MFYIVNIGILYYFCQEIGLHHTSDWQKNQYLQLAISRGAVAFKYYGR